MRARQLTALRFIKAKNGIYTRSGASFFNPRGTGRCVGGARRRSDYRLPDANPRHWPLDGGNVLIFNLMRPDVLPLDDLGLLRAISLNYFSGEPVSRSEAREVAANWQPWRSVAVWYLWRSLDPIPVNY